MNTLLAQSYWRLRWLHLPTGALLLLLQRTPVLRSFVASEFVLEAGAGSVLKGVLAGAATLGVVQTVAGATTFTASPSTPASATVGETFEAALAVTGAKSSTKSYKISGDIPPGLSLSGLSNNVVNSSTLALSGTPTTAGSFTMGLQAYAGTNATGDTDRKTYNYTIDVAAATSTAVAPTIATQPTSLTVTAGASASFSVSADGSPTPDYQWQKDGTAISGATAATFSISTTSVSDAGSYTVVVSNSAGSVTSSAAVLTVTAVGSTGLTITQQPSSVDVAVGGSASFTVTATASGTVTYQWYSDQAGGDDPVAVSGATSAKLTLSNVQAADMGYYFARVTGEGETLDSDGAILTNPGSGSRLANLSTRGRITAGGSLTPGFVLRGDGTKPLLVRGIGPQLIAFGVSTGLVDPTISVIPQGSSTAVFSNDNWGEASNAAAMTTAFGSVGAFGLADGSADAAVLEDFALPNDQGNRGYTVRVESTDATATGIALAEVYDPEALGAAAQLVNVSALGYSGTGSDALVPGFVIEGAAAKTMLIRVVAPSLASFGVAGTMANPRLEVVPLGQTYPIASNDDWGGTAALKAAFATAGAFSLASDDSADAVVLVRLPPGGYTVVVEDVDGGSGIVLVEGYDID